MATITPNNQSLTQAFIESSAKKNEWHTIALNVIQGGGGTITSDVPPPSPRLFQSYNEVTNMQFQVSYINAGEFRPDVSAELINNNGQIVASAFIPKHTRIAAQSTNLVPVQLVPTAISSLSSNKLYILRVRLNGFNSSGNYYFEDSIPIKVR